jgi:hypothetical protein
MDKAQRNHLIDVLSGRRDLFDEIERRRTINSTRKVSGELAQS